LGVVSFLNSRPLIEGLATDPTVTLHPDVPARLPALLKSGVADAALVPVIDVLRSENRWQVVSDACIGCDGETMTVRVFAQRPPDRVDTLWIDRDSHTSVALATVIWRELFGRTVTLRVFDPLADPLAARDAVLLIGDKVVDPRRAGFAYEVDLGGAWRQHTGLPFVFALWAARPGTAPARYDEIAGKLATARDRGVARAAEIARVDGPQHGWPVDLAERYLTRCLRFTLDARMIAGAERFARSCAELELIPPAARIHWPAELRERAAVPA